MRPIFLIGFMCAGKTTLGKALAKTIGRDFVDLDDYVERLAGCTVADIFRDKGEDVFRCLERQALESVSVRDDVIVACGGGTPCRPGAMDTINSLGISIYLKPDMDVLVHRLMDGRAKRPLLAAISNETQMLAFANAKLAEREPYYNRAKILLDSSHLETPQQVAASVEQLLQILDSL